MPKGLTTPYEFVIGIDSGSGFVLDIAFKVLNQAAPGLENNKQSAMMRRTMSRMVTKLFNRGKARRVSSISYGVMSVVIKKIVKMIR